MRKIQQLKLFKIGFIGFVLCASSLSMAQALVAVIDTSKGEIQVELNERAAPTTVANFVNLALRGYYDGLLFHRVVNNFMIQGGDPVGNGSGGPGYRFRGELVLKHNKPGILSMANSGPGTDGSQFFLTRIATPQLDGLHSVFGEVISGLPIVYEIERQEVINSITIRGDTSAILTRRKAQVQEWNKILDETFPDLRAAPSIQ
jgi:peptidyl-prolyl cis-trans isomerase B (cyclophilin B)